MAHRRDDTDSKGERPNRHLETVECPGKWGQHTITYGKPVTVLNTIIT